MLDRLGRDGDYTASCWGRFTEGLLESVIEGRSVACRVAGMVGSGKSAAAEEQVFTVIAFGNAFQYLLGGHAVLHGVAQNEHARSSPCGIEGFEGDRLGILGPGFEVEVDTFGMGRGGDRLHRVRHAGMPMR
ncbi:hypothetical protein D3C72_973050 [compost metagenome]